MGGCIFPLNVTKSQPVCLHTPTFIYLHICIFNYIWLHCFRGTWGQVNRPSRPWLIRHLQDAGSGTEGDEPTAWVQFFRSSLLALIQSEKTKRQIADSDSGNTCEQRRFGWLFFSYPGVSCCLLTGLSVTPEAEWNATAGTFTFQRHALWLFKGNSTEPLNDHRQCFSHRRLEINRCLHSSFTRSLVAFVCVAPELHLTKPLPPTPPLEVDPWKRGWSGEVKENRMRRMKVKLMRGGECCCWRMMLWSVSTFHLPG